MGVNLAYPVPQADRLDKVAVVVDAVDAGADTFDAIARALSVVDRQGNYYANAAAYLGLIEQVPHTHPVRWALTGDGEVYVASDAPARQTLLTGLLAEVPAVQLALEGEGDLSEVVELYTELGLDEETAGRRAQTAATWAAALTANSDLTAETIGREARTVRETATVIAAELAAHRKALEPTPPSICTGCFTQLPTNGICGYC